MARKTVGILTVLLGFMSMTTVPSAHHSRAMFDVSSVISVEGVVTDVQWRFPHMWITLDVPGPNGTTESWGFEGAGAAMMVASGISPQILKVGNRVKIIAHPPRDKLQADGRVHGNGSERQVLFSGNGIQYSR